MAKQNSTTRREDRGDLGSLPAVSVSALEAAGSDAELIELVSEWRATVMVLDKIDARLITLEGTREGDLLESKRDLLDSTAAIFLQRISKLRPSTIAGVSALAAVAGWLFSSDPDDLEAEIDDEGSRGCLDAEAFAKRTIWAILQISKYERAAFCGG